MVVMLADLCYVLWANHWAYTLNSLLSYCAFSFFTC